MKLNHDMIACFVVRADAADTSHEFLQLRRSAGDYMGGTWHTIMGRIERGETAPQAALRELSEEAGLTPSDFYYLNSVNIFYVAAFDGVMLAPSFCAIVDRAAPVILNSEHDAIRWIPRAEIDTAFMWPGDRRMLAELCHEILDNSPAKPFLRLDIPDKAGR